MSVEFRSKSRSNCEAIELIFLANCKEYKPSMPPTFKPFLYDHMSLIVIQLELKASFVRRECWL